MTSKRQPLRGNVSAPGKSVTLLPDRRSRKMAVKLVLAFHVDGKSVGNSEMQFEVPRPAATEGLGLQIPIDARAFVQSLEPHVGPSSASVVAPKPGLWVPGQ